MTLNMHVKRHKTKDPNIQNEVQKSHFINYPSSCLRPNVLDSNLLTRDKYYLLFGMYPSGFRVAHPTQQWLFLRRKSGVEESYHTLLIYILLGSFTKGTNILCR